MGWHQPQITGIICVLTHLMATVAVLHQNDLVANVVGLETYSIVVLFCLGISASSEVSW